LKAELPHVDLPTQRTLDEFELFMNEKLKATGVPGAAVAIVKNSEIIFLKGFGVKEVGTRDKIDTRTLFRLGSVSKSVTSLLAGILVEDSIIGWDDPVSKYLPDFSLRTLPGANELLVKHILSHTTGLPYHAYTNLVEEGHDHEYLTTLLCDINVIGNPGEVYSYQNVAYSIIEQIIAAASCESFETQMKEKVFGPLRMSQASLSYDDFTHNSNAASPHLFRGGRWKQIPVSDTYYNVASAGGINASITDMAKWMLAMLGHQADVISQNALSELYQPRIRATAKNRNFNRWSRIKRSYYGLGWRVIQFPSDTLSYHGGYVNGFRSEVALNLDEELGICVLMNAPGDLADISIPAFLKVYDKMLLEARKPAIALTP
jgi:beta-lactamase class C